MPTLTLTHTHAEGTTLAGTARGDGSADVLRTRPERVQWKWSRNIGDGGRWYVPRSRDRQANRTGIEATATALRAAGFAVTVTIDNAHPRDTADVVEDARERAADRADALHEKADRQLAESDRRYEAANDMASRRPLGQPILVGHHSEGRARADQRRIERHMDAFVEHRAESRETHRRAEAAAHNATGREARRTVENRIKRLRADVARDLRALHGYWRRWGEVRTWVWDETRGDHVLRAVPVDPDSVHGQDLAARIIQNSADRLYWSGRLAGMPAPAKARKPVKGDTVTADGETLVVVRSSKTDVTVSAPTPTHPNRTRRIPWGRISGWQPATTTTATDAETDAETDGQELR